MRHILHLATALLVASQAAPGLAATAKVSTYQVSEQMTAAGFATASAGNDLTYLNANAYEYRGGVGTFAFSGTSNKQSRSSNSASAEATFSDSIRIGKSNNPAFQLSGLGDGTLFELSWSVRPSGSLSTSHSVYSGTTTSFASALYEYNWNFAGAGGSGQRYESKSTNNTATSGGYESPLTGTAYVRLGELVTLNLYARAYAATLGLTNAPASASAQFDHTLKWGGISAVRAFDVDGAEIDLPDGFQLSLLSSDGGFDYFNAAGDNPYIAAVPEPGEWAMLAAGLAVVGAAARRRRRAR